MAWTMDRRWTEVTDTENDCCETHYQDGNRRRTVDWCIYSVTYLNNAPLAFHPIAYGKLCRIFSCDELARTNNGQRILCGMEWHMTAIFVRSELWMRASPPATYLYNTWSDAGTGRYHAADTSFVNDKVANWKWRRDVVMQCAGKVQKLFQWDHNVECLSKGNWLVWHFVYVISFDIKKIWKNCVYVISQDLVFIHLNVYKIRLQINHPFI